MGVIKGDARSLDYYSSYVVNVVPFGLEYYNPLFLKKQAIQKGST